VILRRLVKRRSEAHRIAYLPWVLITSLFAIAVISDERRDATVVLGFLPLAVVLVQIFHPTVLGWALLWVPAAIAAVLLATGHQRYPVASRYFADLALLIGPALAVMIFPPRIRRRASQLRFLAAMVVGILFGAMLLVFALFNRAEPWNKPKRRAQHERSMDEVDRWLHAWVARPVPTAAPGPVKTARL
jgi:MFS family permease